MATVNKVALANGTVLIDLTSDTVKAESNEITPGQSPQGV